MKYSAVTFSSSDMEEWQKDLLISELAEIGFDTFEDIQGGFQGYIPSANIDIQALETVLLNGIQGYHLDYTIQEIEEKNWNQIWESNFNPIIVDNSCYVRATFHRARPEFTYQIVIDPKMSFGTGHHQTTSMMLSFILKNDFQGKNVLDMGCGTGILAILATMKGANKPLAVDYDPICVESVQENIILNNVNNVEAKLGSKEVISGLKFDVIFANINRNILLDQLDTYASCIPSNGELYLSGFYDGEDLDILKQKAESVGFQYVEKKTLDNWCAAKLIKSK